MRFGKKGKLSPKYIGPFKILERFRYVVYRIGLPPNLAWNTSLPPNLAVVHIVFHLSILRKYMSDPTHVVGHETLSLQKNFFEFPDNVHWLRMYIISPYLI